MTKLTEKQFEAEVKRQMKANKCSYEEAKEIVEWDYEIDHGNTELGALSAEQKKLIRSITKADKDPDKKKSVKRERKVDEDKKHIFDILRIPLEGFALNGEIENLTFKNEAEISFTYNGNAYSVKLTKHRPKKETC